METDPSDPIYILQQRAKARREDNEEAWRYWMGRWEALPPSVTNPSVETW
jgi:hypothetical protein